MIVTPPKLSLGKARMAGLESGEYQIHSTRVQPSEREELKRFVSEELYENLEDLLEDAIYRFYKEKPYLRGQAFLQPPAPMVSMRKTDTIQRTGWRQINIFLNKDLATAIHQELAKIATYGRRRVSMSSYLYTGIHWFITSAEPAKPAKNATKTAGKTSKTTQKR